MTPERTISKRPLCFRLALAVGLAALIVAAGLGSPGTGPRPARAGTYTAQAEHPYQENATLMEMKRILRAKAMAKVTAREAEAILPQPLSETRRKALEQLIEPAVERYILSFSELGFERGETMCRLELRAEVNVPALKDFLKRWGTYYTSQRPMYYSLISPPLSQAEEKTLRRLEALSGLERMYSGYPLMTLKHMGEQEGDQTFWEGTLKTVEKSWSAMDRELKSVWVELWSRFFALPKIQSQTFQTVRLSVQGWTSVTAVKAFHRRLTRWSLLVDTVSLERVDMELGQSTGHWEIRTTDVKALRERLQTYLDQRGLSSSLRVVRSRDAAAQGSPAAHSRASP